MLGIVPSVCRRKPIFALYEEAPTTLCVLWKNNSKIREGEGCPSSRGGGGSMEAEVWMILFLLLWFGGLFLIPELVATELRNQIHHILPHI